MTNNNSRYPLNVILEDIRSALNVGAMFRTADAALVSKLILSGITPYPPHNRIPKTALGAVEMVPWEHEKDIAVVLKNYQHTNIVAVELTPDAINYTDYEFQPETTLVFGNEISGVSDRLLTAAMATVKIPMHGEKKSLNVATSFGILVYEVLRQWKLKDLI